MRAPISECWIYKRLCSALLLLCIVSSAVYAELATHQYHSLYRSPSELQAAVQDLYPNAVFSSSGNILLIRAAQQQANEILELLPTLDKPVARYTLLFSSRPDNNINYTTQASAIEGQVFTVTENTNLHFQLAKKAQQLTAISWLHTDYDNQIIDADSLELKISSKGAKQLQINYQLYLKREGKRRLISNSVLASFGEWVALTESPPNEQVKSYRSSQQAPYQLYLKVTE